MIDQTSGTAPLRSQSTGKFAVPVMWNGNTAIAVAGTIDTGSKIGFGPLVRRRPLLPMQQRAAETQNAVTIAEPHLHDVIDRLLALSGLPQDWDRQGAEPIDQMVVSKAITTLRFLIDQARAANFVLPRPAVSPSPGGSIGFEWERDPDVLTIECPRDSDQLHVYVSRADEESEQSVETLPALWDAVRDFLRQSA